MLPKEDQKRASNTMENDIVNRVFLKRLSDRDVKVMFLDGGCKVYVQQKVRGMGFIGPK